MVEDIRCQWVGYTVELNCNPVYCQNSISFGDGQNYKWRGGRDLEKAQIIDLHRGRNIFIYHEHDLGWQLIPISNLNKRILKISTEHSDCVIEQPTRGLLEWNYLLEN